MQQIARKRYKRSTGHSRSHFRSYITACIACAAHESSLLFFVARQVSDFCKEFGFELSDGNLMMMESAVE